MLGVGGRGCEKVCAAGTRGELSWIRFKRSDSGGTGVGPPSLVDLHMQEVVEISLTSADIKFNLGVSVVHHAFLYLRISAVATATVPTEDRIFFFFYFLKHINSSFMFLLREMGLIVLLLRVLL